MDAGCGVGLAGVPGGPDQSGLAAGQAEDSYTPAGKARELEAGPHLHFLQLKGMMGGRREAFDRELIAFAGRYGLLGLFHEQYSQPILPRRKCWVAPEAVIEHGELRRVDPATEGTELSAATPSLRYGGKQRCLPEYRFKAPGYRGGPSSRSRGLRRLKGRLGGLERPEGPYRPCRPRRHCASRRTAISRPVL